MLGLIAEAARMARSQLAASVVTVLIVGAACGVILSTTGQTVQAERAVLARIDEAGTRSIIVTDIEGRAGITPAAISRIEGLSGVEWVVGLGPAFDVRAAGIAGGQPAAARVLYGEIPGVVAHSDWKQSPGTGLVGVEAQTLLGLRVPAGGLETAQGDSLAVVGWFDASDPLSFLDRSLLAGPDPADPQPVVRSIYVLAHTPEQVTSVAEAVVMVLDPFDPTSVGVETSEALAQIRAAVEGELGAFGRRLVLMVLGAGLVLVGLNMYGTVTTRRKDFGRRRALGASRPVIVTLVTLQAALTGLLGALLGTVAGAAVVWRLTEQAPDPAFAVAVATLAVIATLAAALPPSAVAALRDPVKVLRVP
jgi:putative ABC transport system permease protein